MKNLLLSSHPEAIQNTVDNFLALVLCEYLSACAFNEKQIFLLRLNEICKQKQLKESTVKHE